MPKRTRVDQQSQCSTESFSILSKPVLGCLAIASLVNFFLFSRAFSGDIQSEANLDLPSLRQRQGNSLLGTTPAIAKESAETATGEILDDSPGWLKSHLQWHLAHLAKTHANWKSKATRWAIDAEEVEHTGHRKDTTNTASSLSISSKWKAFLGFERTNPTAAFGSDTNPNEQFGDVSDAAVASNDIDHHLILPSSSNHQKINLWDASVTSTPLPKWMQEYFNWHQQQLALLTKENLQSGNQKFLIMYAHINGKSGGMTDRIRPFPLFLRMAAEGKRIFLIRWERPFPLEEFLQPPPGGCNWTVPSVLLEHPTLYPFPFPGGLKEDLYALAKHSPQRVVTTNYQSSDYGELYYKELCKSGAIDETDPEPELYGFYRDLWKVMFQPSPPVADELQKNLRALQLIPGEFATVHIRALYGIKERTNDQMLKLVTNAMNCVSTLRPGGPYFVAADTLIAIQMAMAYAEHHNVSLVSATHDREPLHIEFFNKSDPDLKPEHFYDGFVDMYIMAATRCVAHGKGGFARWGQILGYNSSCTHAHNGFKSSSCEWLDGTKEEIAKRRGYPD